MASTAVSTLPNAVITTTGRAAFWRLMVCRNSRPFMPGSFRSVKTRSTEFSRSNLRPVSASSAENVVNPSSPRFNSSRRRIFASSSTIRIAGMGAHSSLRGVSRDHQMSRFSHGSLLAGSGEKHYKMRAGTTIAVTGTARSFDPNAALMPVNNLRDDGESQTNAGFLRGYEGIENLFPQLRRNAGASVFDAHFHPVKVAAVAAGLRFPCLDTKHATAGPHGIVGILHNINECLFTQALIQRHERQTSRIFFLDLDRRTLPELRNVIQCAIEDGRDVLRRQIRVQRTREIQETRDERAQTVRLRGNVSRQFGGQRIGLAEFLGQHFRRAFDYAEGIANLVGKSGRELAQSGEALGTARLGLGLLQAEIGFGESLRQFLIALGLAPVLDHKA